MMNGSDLKKAAITKAKQVASAAANNAISSNGSQKRRKGQGLKPIITTEEQELSDSKAPSTMKAKETS